ncbi:hypothetical protein K1719_013116 [Acacia pycnantha]|nr:hypothetical protein K1719_013116 [Acacia pycnantha]
MTDITFFLIETLTGPGAQVCWCSGNNFPALDQLATALERLSASVFTWRKGETRQEYWRCIDRALDWGPSDGLCPAAPCLRLRPTTPPSLLSLPRRNFATMFRSP